MKLINRRLALFVASFGAMVIGFQVHAQFAAPTCLPPLCNPAVIQNIPIIGSTQNANINISGDAKLGATLQVGVLAPAFTLPTQNLIYGNVGASLAGNLMLLQYGLLDRLRLTFAGQEQLPPGTLALPSYSFLGDTNSGIYESLPDTINFVTGGVTRLTVDPAGAVTVPGTLAVTGTFSAASFTGVGSGLTSLNAANITSGTLNDARLSTNVPLLNAPNAFTAVNTFSSAGNSFTGSGTGLTSLNASNLSSGNLPDARLSANVALLSGTQTFTAANTFSNAGNSFTGTHAGSGAGLTSLNASNLSSGTLADARLSGTYSGALTFSGNDTFSGMSSFGSAGLAVVGLQNLIYGNIASASTGNLLLLQKNSVDQFKVDNAGNVTVLVNLKVAGQSVCRADGTNCPVTVTLSGTPSYITKFTGTGNTVGNSQIFDNGTNVGIGTATPRSQLTVSGVGQLTSALTDAGNAGGTIQINDTGPTLVGAGGALTFAYSTTNGFLPSAAIKLFAIDSSVNGIGDLAFSTRNLNSDTALTERMRILAGGNVLIGNTNGTSKLTVSGPTRLNGTLTISSGGVLASNFFTASHSDLAGSMNFTTTGGSSPNITFNPAAGGNFGIGTASPIAKLDVQGAPALMRLGDFWTNSDLAAADSWQRFSMGYGIHWDNTNGNYSVTDTTFSQETFSDENANFTWTLHNGALANPQTYALWHTYDRMKLDWGGNLSLPTGNLSVAGTITSAGTPVCLSSGANCPVGIGGSGTNGYIPKFTPNGTTLGNSKIYDDGTNIGINGTPFYKFDVYGDASFRGSTGMGGQPPASTVALLAGQMSFPTGVEGIGSTYGVYGSGSAGAAGVGVSGSAGGYGVFGLGTAAGGTGVYGSSSHYGVSGATTGTNISDYGVIGTIPGGGQGAGVYGNGGTSSGNGVYGESNGIGAGVYGLATNTGSGGSFKAQGNGGTALLANGICAGCKAIIATGDVQLNNNLVVAGTTRLGLVASDSLSPVNGMIDYNSTTNKFRCYENGAWKDCIGAAGGGITGGGTANYLPKFTAASTLGNSLLTDNGTTITAGGHLVPSVDNVDTLGTSALRWKTLHVGPGSVVVHNDATNARIFTMGFSGSTAQLSTDAATPFQIMTGANKGLAMDISGQVGINTTVPTAQLEITPTGGNWNEGIVINPSTVSGWNAIFLRPTIGSIGSSWMVGRSPANTLEILRQGLAGMSGTSRVDAPLEITTDGSILLGGNVTIGGSAGQGVDLRTAGRIISGGQGSGGMWVDGAVQQFVGSIDASTDGIYNAGWFLQVGQNGTVTVPGNLKVGPNNCDGSSTSVCVSSNSTVRTGLIATAPYPGAWSNNGALSAYVDGYYGNVSLAYVINSSNQNAVFSVYASDRIFSSSGMSVLFDNRNYQLSVGGYQANGIVLFDHSNGGSGHVLDIANSGTVQGYIGVNGGTVSYNAFTGSHYAHTDRGPIERGRIVTLTGRNTSLHPEDPTSETVYGVQESSTANDPAILGAYLETESKGADGAPSPALVMAVGNGDMWVTDQGGDIKPGAYLLSSELAGHAMKDPGTYAVAHVIARAGESVDWTKIKPSSDGRKRKKISVFFSSFDLPKDQGPAIEELQKRLDTLERGLKSGKP